MTGEDKFVDSDGVEWKNAGITGSGVQTSAPDFKAILASAPSVEEVLGKPDVYRAWLAKAKEALNG